jgi:predicted secreted protein
MLFKFHNPYTIGEWIHLNERPVLGWVWKMENSIMRNFKMYALHQYYYCGETEEKDMGVTWHEIG